MPLPEHLKRYAIEKILKASCKIPSQYHLPPALLRSSMSLACKAVPVNPSIDIVSAQLSGFPVEIHRSRQAISGKVILHIHGGVFFLGGPDTHRALASEMAAQTGATVYVLDYPLSPEHSYPALMLAVKDAYMALIREGHDARDIIISGDSCGGNLVLAAVIALREEHIILPSALILMSPFLDLTLSGESMLMNKKLDAMLNRELLAQGSQYYINANYPLAHPLVSPLFADLSDLPPTLVQVGSKEILLDDSQRFKELAEDAGTEVILNIYAGMWHVFQMFSHWITPARQALVEIQQFIEKYSPQEK